MATSAAATVIMKMTMMTPVIFPVLIDISTRTRFTAFSISSTHMRTMIALRLTRNPMSPSANRDTAM